MTEAYLRQLKNWLDKVERSKLDTPEKMRIYYAVMEHYAKAKKNVLEDKINEND